MPTQEHRSSTNNAAMLGVPASGLAALPLCPACYPAYAAILSTLGLTALESVRAQAIFTLCALAVVLASLAYRAGNRRGYRPLLLGSVGAGVVLVGKLGVGMDAVTYLGVVPLLIASVWNVWPQRVSGSIPPTQQGPVRSRA